MAKLKHSGDQAFAVETTRLWNKMPLHICAAVSVQLLKSPLKTFFLIGCQFEISLSSISRVRLWCSILQALILFVVLIDF